MTRIASGSENDGYDLESGRLHLSIPLMWKVLQFNSKPKLIGMPTNGLLHHSLAPAVSTEEVDDNKQKDWARNVVGCHSSCHSGCPPRFMYTLN